MTWLLAALVACGGGGGDSRPEDAGAPPVDGGADAGPELSPVERYFEEERALRCAYAIRCEGKTTVPQDACHPAWRDRREDDIAQAVAAGRTVFDQTVADACLARLQAVVDGAPCPNAIDQPLGSDAWPCGLLDPLRGAVPVDGACAWPGTVAGWECVAESVCTPGGECPGRCVALAAEGAPCRVARDCRSDLFCRGGTCEPPSPVGGECSSQADCADGLTCPGGGTCAEPAVAGSACSIDTDCALPLACVGGLCSDPPVEGESCGARCASGTRCVRHLDDTSICQRDGLGSVCVRDPRVPTLEICTGELICAVASGFLGECLVPARAGETCGDGLPCAAGHRCAGGSCATVVAPGAACGAGTVCPTSHSCTGGACVARPLVGQSCSDDARCFEGACTAEVCTVLPDDSDCEGTATVPLGACAGHCSDDVSGFCAANRSAGDDCRSDEECGPAGVCFVPVLSGTCAPICPL